MQFETQDFGYNTSKITYSEETLQGLVDTDGGFSTRVKLRESGNITYECNMRLKQTIANRDVVDSAVHTIGWGAVYDNHKIGESTPEIEEKKDLGEPIDIEHEVISDATPE
jgi:hypothetical protein